MHEHGGKFYFWDEEWGMQIGPFKNLIEVNIAFELYVNSWNVEDHRKNKQHGSISNKVPPPV